MITKYIGSVDSFLKCQSVAFVEVSDRLTLVESGIPDYLPTSNIFSRLKLVSKNAKGQFTVHFTEEERDGFILNYIIMYNQFGDPIGFTNLTQNIDLYKYGIETITLSFDYVIVNKQAYLNIDTDYVSHIIETNEKKAHLNLFDSSLGGYEAVNKSDLMGLKSKRQGFTKNLLDSLRNDKLIYRYSGNLSRGLTYFTNGYWMIYKDDFDQSLFIDIFKIEGIEYLVTYDGAKLKFHRGSEVHEYNVYIESPLHLGSNMILSKYGADGYHIYSTKELASGVRKEILTSSMTNPSRSGGELVSEPLLVTGYKVCKDPIDKSIMLYKMGLNGITTNCVRLNEILKDFGNPKLESQSLVYASKGLMFTANTDDTGLITEASLFTFNLPGKIRNSRLQSWYDSSDLDGKSHDLISKQFDNKVIGTHINDIVFITTNLIYVNKSQYTYKDFRDQSKCTWNRTDINARYPEDTTDPYMYYLDYVKYNQQRGLQKFLIEVNGEFNYDPSIYETTYKLKIYDLIGRTGLRNMEKLIKTYSVDSRDYTVMNLTLDGNIYGYIETENYYKIGRL